MLPRDGEPLHHSRRSFLKSAAASGIGLTLGPRVFATPRDGTPLRSAPARAIIHVHLPGGIAQQESFDSKPFAPSEYRGPYKSIATKVDGVHFSELFKGMAGIADKLCICRSVTHGEAAHERGTHSVFTGYRPSPAVVYPSIGSVVSHELGPNNDLPPYVCIPRPPNPFAGSGYLSSAFAPFSTGSDPASKNFEVRDLSRPKDVDDARYARRRELLSIVDERFRESRDTDAVYAVGTFYERAYSLIDSPTARDAFDVKAEPENLVKEYGDNQAGKRMLLARRLAEAGVRYTMLYFGGWDNHDNIKGAMAGQGPQLDRAFTRLIRDLEDRGLLDSTLVLLSTEFGRSPKINNTEGRDHWPRVFSVILAGGGLKRGVAFGTSDARASEPEDDPVSVGDLAATIYRQLGIDPGKELMAPGDRPLEVVKDGRPLSALIA